MPKLVVVNGVPTLTGPSYAGADAILVVSTQAGYLAGGSGASYTRHAGADISLYRADTLARVFHEPVEYVEKGWPTPAYSYFYYSNLLADIPTAMTGLDEALTSTLPTFRANLAETRHALSTHQQAANPKSSESAL
jgi:hypothetical protein